MITQFFTQNVSETRALSNPTRKCGDDGNTLKNSVSERRNLYNIKKSKIINYKLEKR